MVSAHSNDIVSELSYVGGLLVELQCLGAAGVDKGKQSIAGRNKK